MKEKLTLISSMAREPAGNQKRDDLLYFRKIHVIRKFKPMETEITFWEEL